MITKKQFDDLVTDYVYELVRDMNESELRSYVRNIMYQEKILLRPEHLFEQIEKDYPTLIENNDGLTTGRV
tara:strand:+ start:335 stop:547 length:213 start_codon:yes stop_codon:yes gene_type:complete